MTARTYLAQAREISNAVALKRQRVNRLTVVAEQYAQRADPRGQHITRLIDDYIREIDGDVVAMLEYKRAIERIIAGLTDVRQRQVLEHRYIDGRSWVSIARIMAWDRSTVIRAHDKALSILDAAGMIPGGRKHGKTPPPRTQR